MMRTRLPAAALVFALVMALATPGLADSIDQRRSATQAKKAQAAAKLDTAKADDDQLETALRDLDSSVADQSSTTEAATQAATAARAAVGSAEARLAATEAKMSQLKGAASAMAVRAYVHPGSDTLLGMLGSVDLDEASRRQTLLGHVAATDSDVLGQLRATRQDEQAEQSDLGRLRDQAEQRRAAAAAHLADLEKTRTDQARLKSALDARIAEYTSEVEALARDEASIENLIRSRQSSAPALGPAPAPGAVGKTSAFGLIWPASGPITSPFGMRWGAMHAGIDIGAGFGAPIRAAKAGVVISASSTSGGYGMLTVIDHGGGFSTLYGHQSRFAVSAGETVAQGQVIGYVGCSGHCTGPHLHFETRVNGTPQNPMNYLP